MLRAPFGGKYNYAKSVVHFLSYVHDQPDLQTLLQHACSVNLTHEGHYFAFDEALEFFGVKFVKQNMSGNPIDEEHLKLQIESVQSERERLAHLLSEYLDDNLTACSDRAVCSRQEGVWHLANMLSEAFESPDPVRHPLFAVALEMHKEGFDKIFTAYAKGRERLEELLEQEVRKTKPRVSAGQRRVIIQRHRATELYGQGANLRSTQKMLRTGSAPANLMEIEAPYQETFLPDVTEHIPRPKRRRTTKEEKEILRTLQSHVNLPDSPRNQFYETSSVTLTVRSTYVHNHHIDGFP